MIFKCASDVPWYRGEVYYILYYYIKNDQCADCTHDGASHAGALRRRFIDNYSIFNNKKLQIEVYNYYQRRSIFLKVNELISDLAPVMNQTD